MLFCNPSTWEEEVRGSQVQSHPWLYAEFQASQKQNYFNLLLLLLLLWIEGLDI